MPRYGIVDREYAMRLATWEPDADGAIFMLNLMKYRERADYEGGNGGGATGREADDRYAPIEILEDIGAAVCFAAEVVAGSEDWDRVGVVRYPTRRAFIEMQSREDFQAKHVHKEAGMDHTIVMGTLPAAGVPGPSKPDRVLLEVWRGEAPAPVVDGPSVSFDVEGTIVGDGRTWSGARYTPVPRDADIDLSAAGADRQLLVLDPVIERWS